MMKCPNCGSENIVSQVVQDTNVVTKTKGFGWCKAIIGFLIAWPLALCGFCGMGKSKTTTTTTSRTVNTCQNCGRHF